MIRALTRALAALLLILLASTGALAQWQVGAHNIPVGKGAGVVGFGQATVGTAGRVFLDKGSSADPAFTALSGDVSSISGPGVVVLDSEIHCLAALTSAADKFVVYTGSGTCGLQTVTSTALTVLDDTSTSAMRTTLGLAIGTDVQAFDSDLTTWAGITPAANVGTFLATPNSANERAALTDETGTGVDVFQNGDLGTPSAGIATNLTGTAAGLTAGTVTTNANLTGVITSSGNATSIASQTGTGTKFVVDNGPTLIGTVDVSQAMKLSGDISPTQITSSQNDYAPTGFSTSAVLRLDLDADRSITGIAGGADGLVKIIHNISTHVLTLKNQDAGSSAANRLLLGGDVTLNPDTSITLQYDSTSSRWRAITSPGSGGGGGGGVSSVTVAPGFGLASSGTCTITTSGTCTLAAASSLANIQPINISCAASVSSNALTITLNGNDGNALSSTNPGYFSSRSATAATGTQDVLTLTSSPTLTISSGSTMGFANATAGRLWIVGFNDAGTFRVGAVNALSGTSILALRDNVLASSTAEGGAGAADSAQIIYTGTAVTSKGMRILCYLDYGSGLTTAGTWASAPTLLQMFGPGVPKPGDVVQKLVSQSGAQATGTTIMPGDNTIPQSTEGDQYMTQAITPTATPNVLEIFHGGLYSSSASGAEFGIALFQDSTANALAATMQAAIGANATASGVISYRMLAATTSSTTFKIRVGAHIAGTTRFNGFAGAQVYNGVANSFLTVTEIMG